MNVFNDLIQSNFIRTPVVYIYTCTHATKKYVKKKSVPIRMIFLILQYMYILQSVYSHSEYKLYSVA